jgi:hypothetical protein
VKGARWLGVALLGLTACPADPVPPAGPSAQPVLGDVPKGYRRGALVFDPAANRAVYMGGDHVGGSERLLTYLDTWVLEGGAWRLLEDAGLPDRSEHTAVFDTARARVVLFGGFGTCADGGRRCCAETWELVGDVWERVDVEGPPARVGASMVYDAANARTLLFGGLICSDEDDASVWSYDGTAWTELR